jgi:LysR family transcriptional activator of nhaA
MPSLNFHHLRYFHAVAQSGNLTRAAEKLHVSPSALSVQLAQLESQLGHALFERRGKRLILTEAGRIALDRAEAIFKAGDELVSTLKGRSDLGRHVLRIGALPTLSRNFQMSFLKPVLNQEDVEIVLRSGTFRELLSGLEAHNYDILLTNYVPARDAATPWIAHRIAEQPVALIGHPARICERRALRDLLAEEPLIVPTVETTIRSNLDAFLANEGIHPRFAAEVDDMAMMRLLARENIGLAVVPPIVVQDELASGALIDISSIPDIVETFYAVTLSRRFPNPLVNKLLRA